MGNTTATTTVLVVVVAVYVVECFMAVTLSRVPAKGGDSLCVLGHGRAVKNFLQLFLGPPDPRRITTLGYTKFMSTEDRISYWMTSQPGCSREVAEQIVAQEDAEAQLERLQNLLYGGDGRVFALIEQGAKELADIVEAQTVRNASPQP